VEEEEVSYQKHKVTTDALDTLGTIIDENQKRDAIHLAVLPVTAGANLRPGQHVRLDKEGLAVAFYEGESETPAIGIVDPFLKSAVTNGYEHGPVKPGDRFWLVIYPRVITSLRHVWTHPDIPEEANSLQAQVDDAREESRKWLERFAQRLFSYEPSAWDSGEPVSRLTTLIEGAEGGGFGTDIEYGEDCNPTDEFWMHFERYTGRKVANRPAHFRCAC
jgi:hypothetical protein